MTAPFEPKDRTEKRTLLLVRHAHRDKAAGHEVDNGISAKGLRQTERLTQHYEQVFGARAARVLSSPKLRCVETVAGIAKLVGTTVRVDPLLDEEGPDESHSALVARIQRFHAAWLAGKAPLVVASSHGDWIPDYMDVILGEQVALSKGGWIRIEWKSGQRVTIEVMQDMP